MVDMQLLTCFRCHAVLCCAQETPDRPKMLERLGKWQVAALQQLLDIFDLPTVSKGTKVGSCCRRTAAHVCCFACVAVGDGIAVR